jgi:hypothetical protein
MARIVSMYDVCEDDQAIDVADKFHNVLVGFMLDGFEAGMTGQAHDENDGVEIVFNPDGDD